MRRRDPDNPSLETVRKLLAKTDKFEHKVALLGERYAIQTVRPIGSLHTYYPGQRTELDYTKFGLYLYPTEHWNEPQVYVNGFGIDHCSAVCKGYTITTAPAARDAIRLYRNCVLPKSLWLPDALKSKANAWDVFGIEEVIAIDNGMDLIADAAILVFIHHGVIVLRIPPKRGDLKGKVERFIGVVEQQFVKLLPGYVDRQFIGLDERHSRLRARAKAAANMTVAEYEAKLVDYILKHNEGPHPKLKKSRIRVWRDGQVRAPLLLPTGELQLRTSFALTYEAKVTREGVRVRNRQYNSQALFEKYRIYSGKAIVKVNPDDIRSVLVLFPDENDPVEAHLTNFEFEWPVSLELYELVMKRLTEKGVPDDAEGLSDKFTEELRELQTQPERRTPGTTPAADVKAATHAAAMPAVEAPKPKEKEHDDLASLLGGSRLGHGENGP
jgi:putative transposase